MTTNSKVSEDPTQEECIKFVEKELEWFRTAGYINQPYAQKRINF